MSPLGSGGSKLKGVAIRGREPGKAWLHACPASPAKRLVAKGNYKVVHHGSGPTTAVHCGWALAGHELEELLATLNYNAEDLGRPARRSVGGGRTR